MDITIQPQKLKGHIDAIPSKSQAHRLLICAAFADKPTNLICPDTNRDIEATADCLNALGALIKRTKNGYLISPVKHIPRKATLDCCESGSTLRFMLPIVGALGVDATFLMAGRLPQRPLSPLWEEMERMGCNLSRPTESTLRCQGQLQSGEYWIDGSVSSQFITGLLFAAALMTGNTKIHITGKLESRPYITMTQKALIAFGLDSEDYRIVPAPLRSPGEMIVEGDWSNGAFFLAAQALGSPLTVGNLDRNSAQGDRAVEALLSKLEEHTVISAADIPDLVPILAVVAGAKQGASFTNIGRLRLKESDRVASVISLLESLGGRATATEDTLTVFGTGYTGGTADSCNDHRIAMAAAIAATVSKGPVTILGADCVKKSYPAFWEEYARLGGKYELNIR